jgi:DNA-binding response OmpR family regulator
LSEPSLLLVVEDEYYLLADLEQTLTDAGFAVHIASSGTDALALFSEGSVTYSALVTDVDLRNSVNGWDVAKRVRKSDPAFPVVYVTSATEQEWVSQGVPNSVFMAKPFARARLVTAVTNLLDIRTRPSA